MSRRWPNGWFPAEIAHRQDTPYGWRCDHPENLKLGSETDIGYGTYIQSECGVTIGWGTQIGAHCAIYSVDTIGNRRGPVVIGRNCRIGSYTLILPGASIPDDTFIRAYSIVKP